MKLSLAFYSAKTLLLNEQAVLGLLSRVLRQHREVNSLLNKCQPKLTQENGLTIRLHPISCLHINEQAVMFFLKELLEEEIEKTAFLRTAGMRIKVLDDEVFGNK